MPDFKTIIKPLTLIALTLVLVGCDRQQRIDEAQAAVDKNSAQMRAETTKIERDTERLKAQTVESLYGYEAGQMWLKCMTPPKVPANQKACNALHEKFDKWSKAEDARTQAAAAKW